MEDVRYEQNRIQQLEDEYTMWNTADNNYEENRIQQLEDEYKATPFHEVVQLERKYNIKLGDTHPIELIEKEGEVAKWFRTKYIDTRYTELQQHLGDPTYYIFLGNIAELREDWREFSILTACYDMVARSYYKTLEEFSRCFEKGLEHVLSFIASSQTVCYVPPDYDSAIDFIESGEELLHFEEQYQWIATYLGEIQ